jgi:hypothetical protein
MADHVRYPELVSVASLREQEWCYELRRAHFSPREIAARSFAELGTALSPAQVRARIDSYVREHRAALEANRDELIAAELEDLDQQFRTAARLATPIDAVATALKSHIETGHAMQPDEAMRDAPETVVARDEKTILSALTTMRQIGERRAKLLGLDAPTRAAVDVTVQDAASAELERMLAEAGVETDVQR